jgi:hypothetical protein
MTSRCRLRDSCRSSAISYGLVVAASEGQDPGQQSQGARWGYRAMGIEDIATVLRIVDKLDKIGERGVFDLLVEEPKLSTSHL